MLRVAGILSKKHCVFFLELETRTTHYLLVAADMQVLAFAGRGRTPGGWPPLLLPPRDEVDQDLEKDFLGLDGWCEEACKLADW